MRQGKRVALVIPALDEARSIASVVRSAPAWLDCVVVADNGSTDGTGAIALQAGAVVVVESRRGYGSACLAGLRAVPDCEVVVFADGDASDDLSETETLIAPIMEGRADLVIGSRALGCAARGALTPQQRFGNRLACLLIRLRWGTRFTDLGPFRAITRDALEQLDLADRDYGWTVEMQVKAVRRRMSVAEVPVSCRKRIGSSKISGTLRGILAAGAKILWVIATNALERGGRRSVGHLEIAHGCMCLDSSTQVGDAPAASLNDVQSEQQHIFIACARNDTRQLVADDRPKRGRELIAVNVVDRHSDHLLARLPLGPFAGQGMSERAESAPVDGEQLLGAVDDRVQGTRIGVVDEEKAVDRTRHTNLP